MVKYQEFVSLVFEIARERDRSIDTLEDSQKYLATAAELWSNNKQTVKNLSVAETKAWLYRNA